MSEAKSKPPTFRQGMPLKASMLQQLSDWVWRNRVIFGAGFVTNQTTAGQVVSLASGGGSSSLRAFGTVATTVSPASSQTAPGTYGSGTVKADADGGSGYTAGGAISVKNRWPVSLAVGVLVEFSSTDGGTTWFIDNYYCP